MLLNIKQFNKKDEARRFNVLAFFIYFFMLFSTACTFDDDTSEYDSRTSVKQQLARVIKVKDGDSVILRFEDSTEKEARLFGIDAPEYNQPFGREAKNILSKLVYKKTVLIESKGTDRYQREIVLLLDDSQQTSINQQMIGLGAAWVYSQYQNDKTWANSQNKAKQKSLGLWRNSSAKAPWEWRKREQARKK